MTKLGIIGGTSLGDSKLFAEYKEEVISTEWGDAVVYIGEAIFLQRHGISRTVPPHKINYRANLAALKQLGVTHIIGLNSVGSLKKELAPGMMVIPDDFFCPWFIPTFHDEKCLHTVPTIDEELRSFLTATASKLEMPHTSKGTYIHAMGPRFETPAEIRWMAQVADVVGMTTAGEIPLANELQIPYAFATMVDNYGNGLSGTLDAEECTRTVKANLSKVETFLHSILEEFAK